MCGIAGFLNYPDNLNSYIDSVSTIQGHRGPDNQAVWRSPGVALCHQRLSIIDLSAEANQPMVKDGLVIVFNGEIYNYQKIRENLRKNYQASFNTDSDTEVVLEAFRIFGVDCLNHFKGMFAFAVYQVQSKELFLARDPFGVKPLFYSISGGQLAFASELKTLTKMPGFDKNLNKKGLLSAVNYLWLPESVSMFEGVKKLQSGHYLKVKNHITDTPIPYYKPKRNTINRPLTETIELLDKQLNESIERHMVADVPVSTFLSGGLDSSLISVLAHKHNPNLSTYSINILAEDQIAEQMPDDAKYARQLAKKHGFNHHEVTITPQIVDYLPKMVYHLDEPIGDPAAINTYLISEEATKNGSKVLLSGMGADEIFFGYRRQMATLMAMQFQKLPKGLQKLSRWGAEQLPVQFAGRGFKPGRWAQRFTGFATLPPAQAYMRSYSYYNMDNIGGLFNESMRMTIDELVEEHEVIFNNFYHGDIINQMCYTDTKMFMNGLNLTYTDRASMAASVEVRVPFIDKDLIEMAMSIPGEQKYHNKQAKGILKKVAEQYLPKNIVYRPKASFGAPIRSWISGSLKDMVNDLLNTQNLKNRGIFDPEFVASLIEDDRKGKRDNAYQIYELLTIELWFREFMD